jgi:hypothetical protein
VSLFRIVKYSSLIYFFGRHKSKLFRSIAVLLFALLTSLLYEDVRNYLELQHPGTLLYALLIKIVIVYGSLAFVLWQFRPRRGWSGTAPAKETGKTRPETGAPPAIEPDDRLQALADVERHDRLRSRYDRVLAGEGHAKKS